MNKSPEKIALGIDRFRETAGEILGKRKCALITAAAVTDSCGTPVAHVVKKLVPHSLQAIWSLQHGFLADKQDNMRLSDSFFHRELQVPVRSLYAHSLLPKDEWLHDVDAVVVDVLDVGTRVYTFLNHAVMVMRRLSGTGKAIIVLDRPNPLNGLEMEGNVAEEDYFSIVAQLPVPMRHGLTAAEYLTAAREYGGMDLEIEVIRARGWQRNAGFSGLWTYPSPNMPTPDTAGIYPGAVMLEGTCLSEGRGTTRPFELAGAPFIDASWLGAALSELHPGFYLVPMSFRPEFSKFSGEICHGLLISFKDGCSTGSFGLYYDLIRLIRHRYPESFRWQTPPYEFEMRRAPIDMICGSKRIREWIEEDRTFARVKDLLDPEILEYSQRIRRFLLY